MVVLSVEITIYAPSCHSLKDKRMIVQSIITKVRSKFNVSISEVDFQDIHQSIGIGVAVVSSNMAHTQNVLDEVVRFVESNVEANITNVEFI